MSIPIALPWFPLILLVTGVLDVACAALGWTQAAVGLPAVVLGVPLGIFVHHLRATLAHYGLSEWEDGPSRPPRADTR